MDVYGYYLEHRRVCIWEVNMYMGENTSNKYAAAQECDFVPLRGLFKQFLRPRGLDPEL